MAYRIISELPQNIVIMVFVLHQEPCADGSLDMEYRSNGIIVPSDLFHYSGHDTTISAKNHATENVAMYAEVNENELDIPSVKIYSVDIIMDDEKGTITFSRRLHSTWLINRYGETEGTMADGSQAEAEDFYNIDLINQDMFDTWFIEIMKNDGVLEMLYENDIYMNDTKNMFVLYMSNINIRKYIPMLLKNGMKEELQYIVSQKDATKISKIHINKNVIRIAKGLSKTENFTRGYGSSLIYSSLLLQRFDVNNLETLINFIRKFVRHFRFDFLLNLDVRLGEFNDYLIKNIFSTDFITQSLTYNRTLAISDVVNEIMVYYHDYFNAMDPTEDPLWPDNLKEAHDRATAREKLIQETEGFSNAIAKSEYQDLACVIVKEENEYCFVIPETAEDVREEGRKMKHCVGGYVHDIISRACMILFVRKNGKEYMTLEIKNRSIFQAKKKQNAMPDEEDEKILRRYAKEKGLKILGY